MNDAIDWPAVLAEYERELEQNEREYRQRKERLTVIVSDLREKLSRATQTLGPSGPILSMAEGVYADAKLLDAAAHYLGLIGRDADAREIALALVQGGYEPKGNRANFHKSVYNQLKADSDAAGRIRQNRDKSFRLATEAEMLPEPGPGSRPGIALPSREPNSGGPVFVPTGFGSAPRDLRPPDFG